MPGARLEHTPNSGHTAASGQGGGRCTIKGNIGKSGTRIYHVPGDRFYDRSGVIDFDSDSRVGSQKSAAFRFDARHVLYGKLRPYLNKVATPDFAGKCSTELIPLLPKDGKRCGSPTFPIYME